MKPRHLISISLFLVFLLCSASWGYEDFSAGTSSNTSLALTTWTNFLNQTFFLLVSLSLSGGLASLLAYVESTMKERELLEKQLQDVQMEKMELEESLARFEEPTEIPILMDKIEATRSKIRETKESLDLLLKGGES